MIWRIFEEEPRREIGVVGSGGEGGVEVGKVGFGLEGLEPMLVGSFLGLLGLIWEFKKGL